MLMAKASSAETLVPTDAGAIDFIAHGLGTTHWSEGGRD